VRRIRVPVRRIVIRREGGAGPGYTFSLGCAFAFVAAVVLLLLWLLGQSFQSGPAVANAPPPQSGPVVVSTDPPLPTPTRDLPVVQATMAPPPAITATTVVIVVVQVTATPVPPPPVETPKPLIVVVTPLPKP
jgi:hypothetical protein